MLTAANPRILLAAAALSILVNVVIWWGTIAAALVH